jgi:hypothetical protein
MTEKLFKSLRVVFGSRSGTYDRELMNWAKTEYGKDWQFAYSQMLQGKQPKTGVWQ